MSAGAPPSSSDPRSSRVVAPPAPVAMPCPPSAPPAAAQDEKRPLPPTKMKLLFLRAINCVFGGMNRAWGMAFVGLHAVICIVKVVSFTTDPEVARFWVPIFRAWLYLSLAMVLISCERIYYYTRVYAVKDDPPKQQQAAAAALQLPPPPPAMDMC